MTVLNTSDSWRTASYSGAQNCVELSVTPDDTRVRDTKDRAGGHLTVPQSSWAALFDQL